MRTLILAFLAIAYTTSGVIAQEEREYEDLWVLYIDEDYEKLLSKSVNLTENDKRRKEPMPYLFVAMANFEISKNEKYAEDYPKAFKDANKYAAKWRKKDKDGVTVYDNKDFISELRESTMEVAENYIEEDKASKAKGYYKYMVTYDPLCPGSWLMYSYSLLGINDFTGAK